METSNSTGNFALAAFGVTADLGIMDADADVKTSDGDVVVPNSDLAAPNTAKVKPKKEKAARRYPNIGNGVAVTKSITVSNGMMTACRFNDAVAYFSSPDGTGFKKRTIEIKSVQGRTARKDAQAANTEDKKDSTLYKGDEATLPEGSDSVSIVFELSVRNAMTRPHSISGQGYRRLLQNGFFARATGVSKYIFQCIAENVFSGEWAWRNQEESSSFRVVVTTLNGTQINDAESLAEYMFNALTGRPVHLQVHGVFLLGTGAGSTPVFPSQLMAIGEDKRFFEVNTADDKSAPALRGVKIGNRLREIDVWYHKYPEYMVRLPVEPLGYSMWLSEVLRADDESLIHYMNKLMGDSATDVLSDESVMRFVCGNLLFGFLITEKNADKK